MSKMVTARLPEETVTELDALVSAGSYRSRAEVIKAALDRLLVAERRSAIDRAIVDGYTRIPPEPWAIAAAEDAGRRSIEAEPW